MMLSGLSSIGSDPDATRATCIKVKGQVLLRHASPRPATPRHAPPRPAGCCLHVRSRPPTCQGYFTKLRFFTRDKSYSRWHMLLRARPASRGEEQGRRGVVGWWGGPSLRFVGPRSTHAPRTRALRPLPRRVPRALFKQVLVR